MASVLFLNCPVTFKGKWPKSVFGMGQDPKGMERLWMLFASAAINRCETWCIDLHQSEQRHRGSWICFLFLVPQFGNYLFDNALKRKPL